MKNILKRVIDSSVQFNAGGNNNGGTVTPPVTPGNTNPFGAFYETTSSGADTAPAIDKRLGKVLDANGAALTAAQLAAKDTNGDGRLTGAELANIQIYADLNESGIIDTGEQTSLTQYLISQGLTAAQASNWINTIGIRAEDYRLYTQGAMPMATAIGLRWCAYRLDVLAARAREDWLASHASLQAANDVAWRVMA